MTYNFFLQRLLLGNCFLNYALPWNIQDGDEVIVSGCYLCAEGGRRDKTVANLDGAIDLTIDTFCEEGRRGRDLVPSDDGTCSSELNKWNNLKNVGICTMYDFHDSTDTLKLWTEKRAINKTFFVFHLILIKLGEVVVTHVYYNFTKFHQIRMKNKKVFLIARFSVHNFKVSVELRKLYIVHGYSKYNLGPIYYICTIERMLFLISMQSAIRNIKVGGGCVTWISAYKLGNRGVIWLLARQYVCYAYMLH